MAGETIRFYDPNYDVPVTYDDVILYGPEDGMSPHIERFGYFPQLRGRFPNVHQGFQWTEDDPRELNIMVIREPTDDQAEAYATVARRAQKATYNLHMGMAEDAIFMISAPGDRRIVFIDDLANVAYKQTPRGREIEAGAILTTDVTGLAIYTSDVDCSETMLVAYEPGRPLLYGIAHGGRREAVDDFPREVVEAIKALGYADDSIHAGMVPNLEPEAHTLWPDEMESYVGDVAAWDYYAYRSNETGMWHLDAGMKLAREYMDAGVPAGQIEIYAVGTYASAKAGRGGSYRYERVYNTPTVGFFAGIQVDRVHTRPTKRPLAK